MTHPGKLKQAFLSPQDPPWEAKTGLFSLLRTHPGRLEWAFSPPQDPPWEARMDHYSHLRTHPGRLKRLFREVYPKTGTCGNVQNRQF